MLPAVIFGALLGATAFLGSYIGALYGTRRRLKSAKGDGDSYALHVDVDTADAEKALASLEARVRSLNATVEGSVISAIERISKETGA